MFQENQEEFELIGTHHPMICADNVNLLGENTNTIEKNTQPLL
jgi:hypothetical protein